MNRQNSRERGRRKQKRNERLAIHSSEIRALRKEIRETLNEILGHGWKKRKDDS